MCTETGDATSASQGEAQCRLRRETGRDRASGRRKEHEETSLERDNGLKLEI
jgi:hypothetical protein